MSSGASSPASPAQPSRPGVLRIAFASLVGTTIEWYDFYVYAFAAPLVFAKLFFPEGNAAVATLLAFGTYAVGSLARPLGAVVFGHVGDRSGRRLVLTLTLTLMGVCTVAIGLLPTYASIGLAAPILLTALRFAQSFGVGGEWGGAVLLAVEHAPRRRRVFYGSFPQTSSAIALMLATGAFAILAAMPDGTLLSWGWRMPFLLSAPLILIGLVVRRTIEETPEFTEVAEHEERARLPLADLLRGHWRGVLLATGAVLITIAGFYLASTFMVFYGTDQHLFTESQILTGITFTGFLSMLATPLAGLAGDRWGARHVTAWGIGVGVVFTFPMFWLANTGSVAALWTGISVTMVASSFAFGCVSALISGWFPARVRDSGISVAYQGAGLLGGGLAPVAATALYATSHPPYLFVAGFMTLMGLISLGCVLLHRGADYFEPVPVPIAAAAV